MPFQETQTLPDNDQVRPQIRMFFHGLVIIRSSDGPGNRTCLAELHRDASGHDISIEVRTKEAGKPDLVLLRIIRKLPAGENHVRIVMPPATPTGQRGAFKFVPLNVDPFATTPTPQNRNDFGWIMNLAHARYHGPRIGLRRNGTRGGISIEGGDSRFYTALLLEDDIEVTRDDFHHGTIHGLAAVVGANLYYTGDASIILPGSGDTLPLPQPDLPQPGRTGISYEIYVENSPLLANVEHDELEEYYRVLRKERDDSGDEFDDDEQFRLALQHLPPGFTGSAKFEPRRASARIPCQSMVLD